MKRLAAVYYWILSRRYRVEIKGEEVLGKSGACLFLPNHPAEVDPQLLFPVIARRHSISPMISRQYYNLPIINSLMRRMNAVPVSDLDQGVRDVNVMNNIRDGAMKAFAKGSGIMLYPSGQLMNSGRERLFNKQSAYVLLREIPDDVRIIGVRLHGLWGSMWSKAWTGDSPHFFKTLLKGGLYLLLNLFFFLPKRKVEVEFVDISITAREKARSLNRREFNAYLEEFYNIRGEEQLSYVSHHFLCSKSKRIAPERVDGIINEDIRQIRFNEIQK